MKETTKKNIWNKIIFCGILVFVVFGLIYFLVGKNNLRYLEYNEEYTKINPTQITSNLSDGLVIKQEFVNHADYIEGIGLRFATYENSLKNGDIVVQMYDSNGKELYCGQVSVLDLNDNEDYYFRFENKIHVSRNSRLTLCIQEINNIDGIVATMWCGEKKDDCDMHINDQIVDNTLYFDLISSRDGQFYELFLGALFVLLVSYIAFCMFQKKKAVDGVQTGFGELVEIFTDYGFLLKQLVNRDFAIKYRRSYLGIVWVILNPLLSMIVLSAVFSYLFRFSIENFPVYLILGQVIFNFYSEATQISITTITGAGQMIKKVYVPKYIFPLSKTLFSFLNFVLAFIPVTLVMMFFKIPLTVNIVYLPLLLVTFFAFVLGMSFILSTVQVFLRDTQYLYSIFMTLLGYLTPIFYPITSLSPLFQKLMLLNPLYHYIDFLRVILLDGSTPSVQQTIACTLIGVVFLGLGIKCFRKHQKKFILYI